MSQSHPENPMLDCPHFQSCSAPVCQLDPGKYLRTIIGDQVEPCRLRKAERFALGQSLEWLGLFPHELRAHRRWQRMTPDQRRQFATSGEFHRF